MDHHLAVCLRLGEARFDCERRDPTPAIRRYGHWPTDSGVAAATYPHYPADTGTIRNIDAI